MKTCKHLLILGTALTLLLTSCQKESVTTLSTPNTTDTLFGNTPPPAWTVSPNSDYSNSMTAVVSVDLTKSYPSTDNSWQLSPEDKLGAFADDQCVGVALPTDSLFFLFILPPPPSSSESPITLRYYSAKLRNIFYADISFPFQNGGRQGSAAMPLRPKWSTR